MPLPASLPSGEELLEQLRALYAEGIECPVDAIADDTDLEADLGVDSLTQTELLAITLERYGVSEAGRNVQPGAYPTLPDLVKLIQRLHGS
jgi:acyl carrier protein